MLSRILHWFLSRPDPENPVRWRKDELDCVMAGPPRECGFRRALEKDGHLRHWLGYVYDGQQGGEDEICANIGYGVVWLVLRDEWIGKAWKTEQISESFSDIVARYYREKPALVFRDCSPIGHRIGEISDEEADALLSVMNDPDVVKHKGKPLPPGDEEAFKRKSGS